ncbi:hypothetical protein BJV78DRAFT_1173781 [Lactifluus subvellereus]|nr:hypothetical protein BJV78DRAFT_1173781 [Lactifluus subvellereus]
MGCPSRLGTGHGMMVWIMMSTALTSRTLVVSEIASGPISAICKKAKVTLRRTWISLVRLCKIVLSCPPLRHPDKLCHRRHHRRAARWPSRGNSLLPSRASFVPPPSLDLRSPMVSEPMPPVRALSAPTVSTVITSSLNGQASTSTGSASYCTVPAVTATAVPAGINPRRLAMVVDSETGRERRLYRPKSDATSPSTCQRD